MPTYYIVNMKHIEREGYGPDVPEETAFLMLAEPANGHDTFALYECELPEDFESPSVEEVNDKLAALVESAKDYPPAMAFTRNALRKCNCETKIEFSEKLIERLEFYLEQQAHSPFFMARSAQAELGYRDDCGYYWIVGYRNGRVQWISRDYFVYQDPIDCFMLHRKEIEFRFGEPFRA